MSSQQVLTAVLELKEDIGGVKADVAALTASLVAHAAASAANSVRMTALELHNARVRGAVTVWTAVAVAAGTGFGYFVQFLLAWAKDRPHG